MRRLFVVLATLVSTLTLHAQWPQFRGPDGMGTSAATNLPLTWSETDNVRWKTAIHGRAWSSPVILGTQVWLTTATEDGRQLFAVAIDRDSGKIVHDLKLFDVTGRRTALPEGFHAALAEALTSGNPERADAVMRTHVRYGLAEISGRIGALAPSEWRERRAKIAAHA